jgi:ribosomal protein S27AE
MRWRQSFMAEVSDTLQRLGLRACPVCGSLESLDMSHFPVFLADGRSPAEPGDDLTFAVRVECGTCGHVMLFNAQRYRTGDEKILMLGLTEDEESSLGE